MTQTIVLLMLVGWLACTFVMTVHAGRAKHKSALRDAEQAASLPGAELSDSALARRS
jgi:hypothetical protein